MAANSFGTLFRMTTFGESHGKAVGVIIDGCPAGLEIADEDINSELAHRAPGKSPFTTPRRESDLAEILSGTFEGRTTGAPICIIIANCDHDSSKYTPIQGLLRPGHANYTYLKKYGLFDYRGGGRSSARETACRVAAGAVAKKLLSHYGITVAAYIVQIGPIVSSLRYTDIEALKNATYDDPLFCPDHAASMQMAKSLKGCMEAGDSYGGVVEFMASPVPVGLGDPVYEKIEAKLASALMSLPATKGFEIGSGFHAAAMQGSEHNDIFDVNGDTIVTRTNYSGGTLGGITNGMPVVGRVAFKPTSSIKKAQDTLTTEGEKGIFQLPEGSRHDPCVAIRAVPVVEAMVAITLADALLSNRLAKL